MFSNSKGMTFEVKNKRNFEKFTNIGELNNIFLNDQYVKEKNQKENQKKLKMNKNANIIHQNLWTKATTGSGKFVTVDIHIFKKQH